MLGWTLEEGGIYNIVEEKYLDFQKNSNYDNIKIFVPTRPPNWNYSSKGRGKIGNNSLYRSLCNVVLISTFMAHFSVLP